MTPIHAVQKPRPREKKKPKGLERRQRLTAKKPMSTIGAVRRRFRRADRIIEAEVHAQACICGCGARPEENEVGRIHLIGRRNAWARNAIWNNYPGCKRVGTWLDQDSVGVHAKREILQLTIERGERLTPEEVQPILRRFGYYGEVNADVGHNGA